ncbi:MAG: aminotransferase class III-fold pyridoxal phosphate-dependent enzyme, partial [Thermoplasmata archaeon]
MEPEASRRSARDSAWAGWRIHGRWEPIQVVRADGARFWDDSGHEYLDFASQLVATNLGYGNEAVLRAMALQARSLPYVSPSMTSP